MTSIRPLRRETSVAKLRELISSGEYPLQSRLPPERELCEQLGLSRSGLREGLEVLEAEGKVWRQVGKGTFVGERRYSEIAGIAKFAAACSPQAVVEARALLEPLTTRLAATRASKSDLDAIKKWQRQSANAKNVRTWELWEGAFHRAIVQAVHNDFLLLIFDTFLELRSETLWGELVWVPLTDDRKQQYCRQHLEIVDALIRRDPVQAEAAMKEHMLTVSSDILQVGNRVKRPA